MTPGNLAPETPASGPPDTPETPDTTDTTTSAIPDPPPQIGAAVAQAADAMNAGRSGVSGGSGGGGASTAKPRRSRAAAGQTVPGVSGGGMRSWYSPAELASEMGVHVGRVLRWISAGDLEAVNIGGVARSRRPEWRIAAGKIREFVRRRSSLGRVPASWLEDPEDQGKAVAQRRPACRVKRYSTPE